MEGIAAEAASLAGHLQLGKLILLYDDNNISLDGPTSLSYTENPMLRFDAYGWHTQHVVDGNSTDEIEAAIKAAQLVTDKPSIISVKTIIGFGSPLAGTNKAHGSPLGPDNVKKAKEFFGWNPDESFYVPDEVYAHLRGPGEKGAELQKAWDEKFAAYEGEFKAEAEQFHTSFNGNLPEGWDKDLPVYTPADGKLATRQASGKALTAIKKAVPFMFGGSADLASSNEMDKSGDDSFQPGHYERSNIWFGVREHAMGGIMNGIAHHAGLRTYGGTFLTFSDYMRGAIRLTALAESASTFVFTHDSIGLGEDGPTHQPIEQVTSLRTVPNIVVLRPGDANETTEAWRIAMNTPKSPVCLILSRQALPIFDQSTMGSAREGVTKGAYVLSEADGGTPQLILIATGSEVSLALDSQKALQAEGVATRVVSMPSWELFEKQDKASPIGWSKYTTDEGTNISMNRFGESAPADYLFKEFGFTVDNVVKVAHGVLSGQPVEEDKKQVVS
jgi:transketolase